MLSYRFSIRQRNSLKSNTNPTATTLAPILAWLAVSPECMFTFTCYHGITVTIPIHVEECAVCWLESVAPDSGGWPETMKVPAGVVPGRHWGPVEAFRKWEKDIARAGRFERYP